MGFVRRYELVIIKVSDGSVILRGLLVDEGNDSDNRSRVYDWLRNVFTERSYDMFRAVCDIRDYLLNVGTCYGHAEYVFGGYRMSFDAV